MDPEHFLVPSTRNDHVATGNNKYAAACIRRGTPLPTTTRFRSIDAKVLVVGEATVADTKADRSDDGPRRSIYDCPVGISRMHSAQAARYFHEKYRGGVEISVMNFANGNCPGGGYGAGSRAQEECLCRQFPLYYPSLARTDKSCGTVGGIGGKGRLYPFGACMDGGIVKGEDRYSDVLYTAKVQLLREDGTQQHTAVQNSDERLFANFVAATAPCRQRVNERGLLEAIFNTVVAPIVMDTVSHERSETDHDGTQRGGTGKKRALILGAWGCGAFGNDPYEMGERFARVLGTIVIEGKNLSGDRLDLPFWYDEIHFAIPVYGKGEEKNLSGFMSALDAFCERSQRSLQKIGDMDQNPVSTPKSQKQDRGAALDQNCAESNLGRRSEQLLQKIGDMEQNPVSTLKRQKQDRGAALDQHCAKSNLGTESAPQKDNAIDL